MSSLLVCGVALTLPSITSGQHIVCVDKIHVCSGLCLVGI
jgi:hypothetical protein